MARNLGFSSPNCFYPMKSIKRLLIRQGLICYYIRTPALCLVRVFCSQEGLFSLIWARNELLIHRLIPTFHYGVQVCFYHRIEIVEMVMWNGRFQDGTGGSGNRRQRHPRNTDPLHVALTMTSNDWALPFEKTTTFIRSCCRYRISCV